MNSSPKPWNNRCSATMRSSPSIAASFATDGTNFLGNVDADRAPGDAAPAANAARSAKLIDPVRQLVRHPLPIARARRTAHRSTVDIGEVHGEAAIPPPFAFRRARSEI